MKRMEDESADGLATDEPLLSAHKLQAEELRKYRAASPPSS